MMKCPENESRFVSLRFDQQVAVVTIDNPPLNLLSNEAKGQLLDIFHALPKHEEHRAIILRSSGTKAFSAGANLNEFPQRIADGNAAQVARQGHQLIDAIRNCGKPTVALIDGVAFGAGLELTLAADFRLATERSAFALPEVTRGVFPGNGGTQLLPKLIGAPRALELMLTARPIDAKKAQRIGLVTQIVSQESPMEEALRLAQHLASLPVAAVKHIRRLVRTATEESLPTGLALEAQLFDEVFKTSDVIEGINAFREKRHPVFK